MDLERLTELKIVKTITKSIQAVATGNCSAEPNRHNQGRNPEYPLDFVKAGDFPFGVQRNKRLERRTRPLLV
jgi:hypothetical protein